jgi:hypothetical protein
MKTFHLALFVWFVTNVTTASAQTLVGERLRLNTGPCVIRSGAGDPSGVVTGNTCDVWIRTDGSPSTAMVYVKESGTGTTTGWKPIITGAVASPDASYVTRTSDTSLSNEFALGSLATGYLKNTITTGIPTVQVPPIPVADGGTGVSTASPNLVFAGPTSGGAAPPAFRSLVNADLPVVDVPHGGTGTSSLTLNGVLYGNTTSPVQVTAAGAINSVLWVGSTGGGSGANVALASNGATATASSTFSGSGSYLPAHVINGSRTGATWGTNGGWNDNTVNTFPDWLQIDFSGSKTIDTIDVITLQDAIDGIEPDTSMTCSLYCVSAYDVQYWNGSTWVTITSVSGNNNVWRRFTFSSVTTTAIRINITNTLDATDHFSRLVEVQAFEVTGGTPTAPAFTTTPIVSTLTTTGLAAIGGTLDVDGNTTLDGHVGAAGFASRTIGWRVTNPGAADFRFLYVDEMHAKTFIADLEQALAGGQIITKSVAIVVVFTCPAAGNTATLVVEDLPGADNMQVFDTSDYVAIRTFSRAAQTLTIADCVGTVSAPDTSLVGMQSWTFTRGSGGSAGTMASSAVVPPGTLALDFGVSGNGYYEVSAVDGIDAVNSPYAQVVTWATAPVAANRTVRTRFGKLTGITGTANEYGMIAGTYAATNGTYFRASNSAFELHGIDLKLWDGATNTFFLNHSTPYFSMGSPAPSAYGSGVGCWQGKDSGVYKWRCGDPAGGLIAWDGTTLGVYGFINATQGGTIGGFSLGSDYIRDTGNSFGFASTVTGGDDTRFWAGATFANRATAPMRISESGDIVAGGGFVLIDDATGIAIPPGTTDGPALQRGYKFTASDSAPYGLYADDIDLGGGTFRRKLWLLSRASSNRAQVWIEANNASGGLARIVLDSLSTGSVSITGDTVLGGNLFGVGYIVERNRGTPMGDWTPVTYSSGNFTASAGTWTVESGDQTTYAYTLIGNTMHVMVALENTSTSAGMTTELRVAIPSGKTATRLVEGTFRALDNANGTIGFWLVTVGGTTIRLFKTATGTDNWTSSATNVTAVYGTMTFEVQ